MEKFNKQNSEEYFTWGLLTSVLARGHLFVDFVPPDGIIRRDRQDLDEQTGHKLSLLIQRKIQDLTVIHVSCTESTYPHEINVEIANAISDRRRQIERRAAQSVFHSRGLNQRGDQKDTKLNGGKTSRRQDRNTLGSLGSSGLSASSSGFTKPSANASSAASGVHAAAASKKGANPPFSGSGSAFSTRTDPALFGNNSLGTCSKTDLDHRLCESYVLLLDGMERAPPETLSSIMDLVTLRTFYVPYPDVSDEVANPNTRANAYVRVVLPKQFTVVATSSACCAPMLFGPRASRHPTKHGDAIPCIPHSFLSCFTLRIPLNAEHLFDQHQNSRPSSKPGTQGRGRRRVSYEFRALNALFLATQNIHVTPEFSFHLRDMLTALRMHPMVEHGPTMSTLSKLEGAVVAFATLSSRKYVVPSDILAVVVETLSHQIVLKRDWNIDALSKPTDPPSCYIQPPKEWHPVAVARFIVHQVFEFYLPVLR